MIEAVQPLPRVTPSAYQDYSPEFKLEAMILLEANGGKIRETARQLKIQDSTLRYWIEQDNEETRRIRAGAKGDYADAFERVSRIYLDRAAEPDAVDKTSGYYAVIAASDAMKSSQLLRGQPTEIVEHVESRKVLVLMADALGVAGEAIDITPDP
jgi:transposase-like protein